MSWGNTIEECKEDIKEAIEIYLEDIPEWQSIYDPSPIEYWKMFYELRYQRERDNIDDMQDKELAIKESLHKEKNVILQYA